MKANGKYVVIVAFLAVLAVVFGIIGTVAPPLAEEVTPSQFSSSSSSSVAHFANPPTYDSGWVNMTSKAGQYVTLKHDLNTTDVVVDITGKQNLYPIGGAQAWSKTYGGTSGDIAYSVVLTGDGGYALAGVTTSYGAGGDFWLVKTDAAGNALWNKTYGGTSSEEAYSVVQASDGGYALAGYTDPYGEGYYDFWLVKTDPSGTMQWSKTYGGASNDIATAFSVVQTMDGGYALAGYTTSGGLDFWLVKTDAAGNALWNKTYGGANGELARSVVQTGDGGYALAGLTDSGGGDFWLVKTDAAGTMQWSKTYGGASTDYAFSVVQTMDGGYALAGYTTSFGGSFEFWLVKVNADSDLEHQRNLGIDTGLARTGLTNTTIILYRGITDPYWNFVRVRMWLIKEPTWIYGDINMDGIVDAKDLYIVGRNYGKTFSLLSLTGIVAIAGIRTVKKRRQPKQPSYIS